MKNKSSKKKTGVIVGVVALVVLVIAGVLWAKDYYTKRYVASDVFYTQIPADEVNVDSWLLDDEGKEIAEGKEYELKGYNAEGKERTVRFFARGKAQDYYAPGTFIRVEVSETLELGERVVTEKDVPSAALEQIRDKGTSIA